MLFETRGATLTIAPKPLVIYEDIFHGTPVVETGSGSTATIAIPTGAEVGDILFVFYHLQSFFGQVSPYQMYPSSTSYDGGSYALIDNGFEFVDIATTSTPTYSYNPIGNPIATDHDTISECYGKVIDSLDDVTLTFEIGQTGDLPTDYGTRPYDGEWIVAAVVVRADTGYPFLGQNYQRVNIYNNSGLGIYHTGTNLSVSPGSLLIVFAPASTPVGNAPRSDFEELFDVQTSGFGLSAAWKYFYSFGTSGLYTATTDGSAYVGFGMFELPKT